VIVDPGCCGHCDPVSSTDLLGANRVRAEDARNCPGGVACGACPTISELERTRQNFFVSCGYGTCRILDVRETNATYCTTDDDCHLRLGAGCCEACNGPGLIAVANTDYLDSTVCRDVSCDDCVPQIPAGFRAACGNPDFSEHQCGVLATSGGRANAN
jgi:hypothetical protein